MSPADEGLPVLLVRAGRVEDAARVLSELIDNDVTEQQTPEGGAPPGRVWRLLNKYYRADVRVWPVCDPAVGAAADTPVPQGCVEALVLYLAEHECTVEALTRRAAACGAVTSQAAVRVAACEAARAPDALAAAAAAQGLELVPLREPCERAERAEPGEPFAELHGWERVRAALHAHTWRGLVRLDRPPNAATGPPLSEPPEGEERDGDSSDTPPREHEAEAEELDDELMLQRAEQFAALLGALPAARGEGGGDDERLRRAEALVAAFCRALGDPAPSGW